MLEISDISTLRTALSPHLLSSAELRVWCQDGTSLTLDLPIHGLLDYAHAEKFVAKCYTLLSGLAKEQEALSGSTSGVKSDAR